MPIDGNGSDDDRIPTRDELDEIEANKVTPLPEKKPQNPDGDDSIAQSPPQKLEQGLTDQDKEVLKKYLGRSPFLLPIGLFGGAWWYQWKQDVMDPNFCILLIAAVLTSAVAVGIALETHTDQKLEPDFLSRAKGPMIQSMPGIAKAVVLLAVIECGLAYAIAPEKTLDFAQSFKDIGNWDQPQITTATGIVAGSLAAILFIGVALGCWSSLGKQSVEEGNEKGKNLGA